MFLFGFLFHLENFFLIYCQDQFNQLLDEFQHRLYLTWSQWSKLTHDLLLFTKLLFNLTLYQTRSILARTLTSRSFFSDSPTLRPNSFNWFHLCVCLAMEVFEFFVLFYFCITQIDFFSLVDIVWLAQSIVLKDQMIGLRRSNMVNFRVNSIWILKNRKNE